jgi:hypothetical protein
MPDLAKNILTGRIVDARELADTGDGLEDNWKCPGCDVPMTPVACGAGPYKKVPHFRAEEPHKIDCDFDGLRRIVVNGRVKPVRGVIPITDGMPSILVLAGERLQRPSIANEDDGVVGVCGGARRRGTEVMGARWHEATASNIRRIAEAYCGYPDERGRPLKVPGHFGSTYEDCFRRLKSTKGYSRFRRRVMFAPIRFSKPLETGGITEIELDSVVWPEVSGENGNWKPLARYRLALPSGNWSGKSYKNFSKDLKEAQREQRDAHNEGGDWKVFAFFLGDQSEDDLTLFKVIDHRLICFLTVRDDDLPK